jgi:hypothetical protein
MRLSLLSTILIRGIVPGALVPILACPPILFSQPAPLDDDHIVNSQAL